MKVQQSTIHDMPLKSGVFFLHCCHPPLASSFEKSLCLINHCVGKLSVCHPISVYSNIFLIISQTFQSWFITRRSYRIAFGRFLIQFSGHVSRDTSTTYHLTGWWMFVIRIKTTYTKVFIAVRTMTHLFECSSCWWLTIRTLFISWRAWLDSHMWGSAVDWSCILNFVVTLR